MTNTVKAILELTKIRITIAVSFTTITGFVLANNGFSLYMVFTVIGIFMLACGSSVLNHLQELRYDAKMNRTIQRPLPSGKISILAAFILSIFLIITGTIILYFFSTLLAMFLGLLALVWYNLIYTPLKRVTAFAVIPGAIIGAIPPIAGWAAAGGEILNLQVLFVALFFFSWQVPHFILLVVKYESEYKKAGFPVLTTIFSMKGLLLFIWFWVLLSVTSAVGLILVGLIHSFISISGIILFSLWIFIGFTIPLAQNPNKFQPRKYFIQINLYVLIIILFMAFDHVLI